MNDNGQDGKSTFYDTWLAASDRHQGGMVGNDTNRQPR